MQPKKTSKIAGLAMAAAILCPAGVSAQSPSSTQSPGSGESPGAASAKQPAATPGGGVPSLLGSWSGQNHTISDKKGLLTRDRTVHITDQTDRRFRGHFVYAEGRKDFFGVIYPDNLSFTWVASDSKGYNLGRILGPDRISACYVESGAEATAGCADLARVKK